MAVVNGILMQPVTGNEEAGAIAVEETCQGFRCIDRDECYVYDAHQKATTFAHCGSDCIAVLAEEQLRFRYRDIHGHLKMISTDEVQELMQCTYTSKLLFQRTGMLRNYAFWGFSDSVIDGFECINAENLDSSIISSSVCIGHVPSLCDTEDNALGLFAIGDISELEFLGEYTGVLKVHADSNSDNFDAYGVRYPSVFEGGDLYVSASEYGNVIRCINHSFMPNARFVPMISHGILHIFCFTIKPIAKGEQIFVNYGSAYWKCVGVDPIAI